jgi:hypothetical protein
MVRDEDSERERVRGVVRSTCDRSTEFEKIGFVSTLQKE